MANPLSYRADIHLSDSDSDDSDKDTSHWKRDTKQNAMRNLKKISAPDPHAANGKEANNVEHAAKQNVNQMQDSTLLNPPLQPQSANQQGRKKNNIWRDVLQDQMMAETLTNCTLKRKLISFEDRGVESYDFTLARKYYESLEKGTQFKLDDDDDDGGGGDDDDDNDTAPSSPVHVKRSRSSPPADGRKFRPSQKYVKLNGVQKDAARKIVKILNENKAYLICRIVKFLGIKKAFDLLKRTEEVEEAGGMMICNNSRRRTPGGVYLQLLRTDSSIKKKLKDKIFEGERNSYEMKLMYEEKKKQKALAAAKRKLLKEVEKEKLKLASSPHPEPEDSPILLDEEMDMSSDVPSFDQKANIDLEDGEIAD